jgi:hypothetical protein
MTAPVARPPRWLRGLAGRLLVDRDREFLLADLDDEFQTRRAQGRAATAWYAAQVGHAAWTRRFNRGRAGSHPAGQNGGRVLNAL